MTQLVEILVSSISSRCALSTLVDGFDQIIEVAEAMVHAISFMEQAVTELLFTILV